MKEYEWDIIAVGVARSCIWIEARAAADANVERELNLREQAEQLEYVERHARLEDRHMSMMFDLQEAINLLKAGTSK